MHSFKSWKSPNRELYSKIATNDGDAITVSDEGTTRQSHERSYMSKALLAASLITNIAVFVSAALLYCQTTGVSRASDLFPGDPPFPAFHREVRYFDAERLYSDRPNEQTDAAWEALSGPASDHRGFIKVKTTNVPEMNSTAVDEDDSIFGVSMLHQLHCLGGIRKMFWDVLEGRIDRHELLAEYPKDGVDPSFAATTHGLWHVAHCFDYVRQGLMCAADLSLEWPVEVNGQTLVVGWNNAHQCTSWNEVWDYIESHAA